MYQALTADQFGRRINADAHSGYGLPIGGVLATENAVIPYGVGVDIGCSNVV
jgi:RNA-splicing ligase RtcB